MVNIRAMIQRRKDNFREMQRRRLQAENIKRAEELQKLRTQRTQLEGRARLEQYRKDEIKGIEKAQGKLDSSGFNQNRFQAFSKGLANTINNQKIPHPTRPTEKVKYVRTGKTKTSRKKRLGGLAQVNQGSRGIQFGGGQSPFVGGGGKGPFG